MSTCYTSKLNNMNKYLFAVILSLTIISCKKDDVTIDQKKDYSAFLATTSKSFTGSLDKTYFNWRFGLGQFQGAAGYENGNGICDPADPDRIVFFGLTSDASGQTRFRLYSPKYNAGSEAEFSKVFSVGKKKLGDFRNDFYLSIVRDNNTFQSNGSSPISEIEILKTEVFSDYLGEKLRVWFSINANLSSCNCQNSNTTLRDGLMLAEFYGFKKEE